MNDNENSGRPKKRSSFAEAFYGAGNDIYEQDQNFLLPNEVPQAAIADPSSFNQNMGGQQNFNYQMENPAYNPQASSLFSVPPPAAPRLDQVQQQNPNINLSNNNSARQNRNYDVLLRGRGNVNTMENLQRSQHEQRPDNHIQGNQINGQPQYMPYPNVQNNNNRINNENLGGLNYNADADYDQRLLAGLRDPANANGGDPDAGENGPRDVQRRMHIRRLKQEQINDGCFSVLIIMISVMYGLGGAGCPDIAPLKMWVSFEVGYYVFNLIFVWAYYQYLKTRNRENVKFLIFNCILNVIHCAWLIYGNVLYFNYGATCAEKNPNDNITWIMLAQVVVGYIPLIKCCSFTTLILCFGPTFLRALRRARRPDADWVPTGSDILKHFYKEKFDTTQHEEGLECTICMVEYEPNDEIITLPCDTRHFFHAHCIENWLKQNNSCPLCKKPITLDDVKNQKKRRHSELKNKKKSTVSREDQSNSLQPQPEQNQIAQI